MKNPTFGVLLITALVVFAAGCGKKPTSPSTPPAPPSPPPQSGVSGQATGAATTSSVALGQQIFESGNGPSGKHIAFKKGMDAFRQNPVGCAFCHGYNGQGKRIPSFGQTPSITYAALREPLNGKPAMYPNDSMVKRAVTQGLDEGGHQLSTAMPRWQMTSQEFTALLAYLKTLKQGTGDQQSGGQASATGTGSGRGMGPGMGRGHMSGGANMPGRMGGGMRRGGMGGRGS